MTPKEFFIKVSKMRECQIRWEKNRSESAYATMRRLENEIDSEIRRVNEITESNQENKQGLLF